MGSHPSRHILTTLPSTAESMDVDTDRARLSVGADDRGHTSQRPPVNPRSQVEATEPAMRPCLGHGLSQSRSSQPPDLHRHKPSNQAKPPASLHMSAVTLDTQTLRNQRT